MTTTAKQQQQTHDPRSTPAASIEVQHQIRTNAAQLQEYFSDLYSWEKSVTQKEELRSKARVQQQQHAAEAARATPSPPPRPRTSIDSIATDGSAATKKQSHPAAHTHDKGYNKWSKFDVEAALREADDDEDSTTNTASASSGTNTIVVPTSPSSTALAPALATTTTAAAAAATIASATSRADAAREEGNAHYKRGDFVAAIKSYTRCLGFDARNAVVLSNRAMALLKNREFAKAEDDCDLALRVAPQHVKSLSRRATARNALGKHRLALLDLECAAALEPKNRQLQTQIAATKDQLRAAIKRAPMQTTAVHIEVLDDDVDSNNDNSEAATQSVKTQPTDYDAQGDVVTKESAQDGNQPERLGLVEGLPTATPSHQSVVPEKRSEPVATTTTTDTRTPPERAVRTKHIVPTAPTKPPTTAYEFSRVWKTLALRGDSDQRAQLLVARATYLQRMKPATLRTVFKDSIESDVLCDAFHVFRYATLASEDIDSKALAFVFAFAQALADVPRFQMTVMFLSDREKSDIAWVFARLRVAAAAGQLSGIASVDALDALEKRYELS